MPAGPSGPTQTQSQTQSRIDRDRERERERERTALDEAYTAAAAATGNDEDLISGGGSGGTAAGRKNNKGTPSEELSVMIDDMLADLTGRFHAVTSEIMAKMDDMGRRIDNLESSLNQGAEGRKEDEDEEEESKKKGRGD